MNDDFRGMRILVVEDETMVSMLLEDYLEELGCDVVGSVADVQQAIEMSQRGSIDGAILDVNLGGTPSYPVAAALDEMAIPYLFITGYGEAGLDADYRDRPVLQKPFTVSTFQQCLSDLRISKSS